MTVSRKLIIFLIGSGLIYLILLVSLLIASGESRIIKFGTFGYWFSLFFSGWALIIALINTILAENHRISEKHKSVVDDFWFRKIFGEHSIPKFINEIGIQISAIHAAPNEDQIIKSADAISSLSHLFDPLDGISGSKDLIRSAYDLLDEMEDSLLKMLELDGDLNESEAKATLQDGRSKMLGILSQYHLNLIGHQE